MNSSSSRKRALVIGGGGAGGNAWAIGVIAGLDLPPADLVVGTSAGATVAAQITGASPARLLDDILAAVVPPSRGPGPVADYLATTNDIIALASDPGDLRRRMGAAALALEDRTAQWRSVVAARLPSHTWPEQRVLITAVDAQTGEPVVFDRGSGVDLVDAVAASSSAFMAYAIGDRRCITGGYRSGENADLAAGYERVVVISPFSGRARVPVEWGTHLAAQVERLRAQGSRVETIFPDDETRAILGIQPDGTSATIMDLSTRAPAARAGYAQGQALAGPLAEFWVTD